ncbi:GntR family transcriptional regulator [Catellatospora paridis]|uniref:GntR family transcriptional regulator n=1 Tax=Catellatospora paridis TaxID=1617086 RepID=UPI001E2F2CC0|nr:GntR family transcriptional regulator [Catellatospora paridis]
MTAAQITADLTDRIARNEQGYQVDDQLPSYQELASIYSTSVATASRVVRTLREAGLVVGVPGKGTYVARRN